MSGMALAPIATHAAPSCPSATELVRGDEGALVRVLVHTAGRATLLAIGMSLAGHADRHLARDAIAGALMLEALMLVNAARQKTWPRGW